MFELAFMIAVCCIHTIIIYMLIVQWYKIALKLRKTCKLSDVGSEALCTSACWYWQNISSLKSLPSLFVFSLHQFATQSCKTQTLSLSVSSFSFSVIPSHFKYYYSETKTFTSWKPDCYISIWYSPHHRMISWHIRNKDIHILKLVLYITPR